MDVMDMVRCLAWGGGRLATGCLRGGAALWSDRGMLVAAMVCHTDAIRPLEFQLSSVLLRPPCSFAKIALKSRVE